MTVIPLAINAYFKSDGINYIRNGFKKDILYPELSRYVDSLSMQEKKVVYNDSYKSDVGYKRMLSEFIKDGSDTGDNEEDEGEDLTEIDFPEIVLRILGIATEKCNENHINEWIGGTYHGIPIRFFEAKLLNITYEGEGKNRYSVEKQMFEGQGYIFKSKTELPFSLQYNINSNVSDFSFENFDNVCMGYKYKQLYDSYRLIEKVELSDEELAVMHDIETTKFKDCLLNLAKVFKIYTKRVNHLNKVKTLSNNWLIRLQKQYVIIIRNGDYDYYEFNLDKKLDVEISKFETEMMEFVSVLASAAALIQHLEDERGPRKG